MTTKEKVIELYNSGEGISEIADTLNIAEKQVYIYLLSENYITATIPNTVNYRLEFSEKWTNMLKLFRGITGLEKIYLSPKEENRERVK